MNVEHECHCIFAKYYIEIMGELLRGCSKFTFIILSGWVVQNFENSKCLIVVMNWKCYSMCENL